MESVFCSLHLPNSHSLPPPSLSLSSSFCRSERLSTPPHCSPTFQLSLDKSGWRKGVVRHWNAAKGGLILVSPLKRLPGGRKVISYLPNADNSSGEKESLSSSLPNSKIGTTVGAADSKLVPTSRSRGRFSLDPFRGKSGSVSFCGLSYELIERRNLVSSPYKDGVGSILWVVGPLALISALLVPQFFLGSAIEAFLKDEILAEIVASFSSEVIFYAGIAAFLSVTDHVQRPYLDFSPKQWSLITGLKGYLSSAFFTMGLKVFAPLLAAYVNWPIIGLPALVAVAPFLLGCAAQFAFEMSLAKRNSSCWPVLPIIFEVYRLYQLNKGAHFIEGLIHSMRGSAVTPELLERSGALFSMVAVLQILGVICLWSLTTFLLRLFPSRPVAENY